MISSRASSSRTHAACVRFSLLVCLLALSVSMARAADSIYWANESGQIRVGPLSGSGDGPASTVVGGEGGPCGVAIDPRPAPIGQKIYWANFGGGEIRRANLDGTDVETVLTTLQSAPCGVAIDPVADKIYWANFCSVPASSCAPAGTTGSCGCGTIMSASLAGGVPATPDAPLFAFEDGPSGIAIDPAAGKIYWTNQFPGTTKGAVRTGPLSGGTASTLFAAEANPLGLAIDPSAGKVYWANLVSCCSGPGAVRLGNLDGSGTPVDLFAGEPGPAGVAIDPTAVPAKIYWATFGSGKIRVGPLAGSGDGPASSLFEGESFSNLPAISRCGDGLVIGSEACDDRGTVDGDGCSATCAVEDGWTCSGTPSVCTPLGCAAHGAEGSPCDDGNACTTQDTCCRGSCVGGPPLRCDDGNLCTDDACDPAIGCTNTARTCAEVQCRQAACDPATGACTYRQKAEGSSCSDGNPCTAGDNCCSGTCIGHAYTTSACDDGNACTTGDRCSYGSCRGGVPPNCNDANPCTNDACDRSLGCTHVPNAATCSDGNPCTRNDRCSAGSCVGGSPPNCDDGNPCTVDSCTPTGCKNTPLVCPAAPDACHGAGTCSPATGACSYASKPDGTYCDDGNPCTQADTCRGGACAGGPPPSCPRCSIEADTTVRQQFPTQNFSSSQDLEAASAPNSQTLFRLRVTSSGPIGGARLRLTTKRAALVSAGSIHPVPCSWLPSGVNWSSKPALGAILDTKAPAAANQQVDFDVSSVITAAGTYCFGIDNPGGNAAYASVESPTPSLRPVVLLQSSCGCVP